MVEEDDPSIAYEKARKKIDKIVEKLEKALPLKEEESSGSAPGEIESNFTEDEFCKIVEKGKEYIRAGEVIQLVLSESLNMRHLQINPATLPLLESTAARYADIFTSLL